MNKLLIAFLFILTLNIISSPAFAQDSDGDGIPDNLDNCPTDYNPNQEDTYPPGGNGCGDACECEGNFDGDQDVDGTDAAVFKEDFGRSGFSNPCPPTSPCLFTCQGTLSPLRRWCDRGNGTVKDMTTGLVWLQKADWGGDKSWEDCTTNDDAHTRAGLLYAGMSGATLSDGSVVGDWRLPTKAELVGITEGDDYIRSSQMYFFTGVQSDFYWSSTTYATYTPNAFRVSMSDGLVRSDPKTYTDYVWPVRLGRINPPPPRFTDNGDGTVTDNDTGLIWLKDANCSEFLGGVNWSLANITVGGLSNGYCGLTDGSNPGDWRIPTVEETEALQCGEYLDPCLCNTSGSGQASDGDPFTNVQFVLGDFYWTSTPGPNPNSRFVEDFDNASISAHGDETTPQFVWPVRDP